MSDITILAGSDENTVVIQDSGDIVVVAVSDDNVVVTGVAQAGPPGPAGPAGPIGPIGTADGNIIYTKAETDILLANKANLVHTHVLNDITDFEGIILSSGTF